VCDTARDEVGVTLFIAAVLFGVIAVGTAGEDAVAVTVAVTTAGDLLDSLPPSDC
jgi:hypothetical protein